MTQPTEERARVDSGRCPNCRSIDWVNFCCLSCGHQSDRLAFAQHPSSGGEDTVAFVQEWMMSGDHEPTQWDRDFAAAIDARATPSPSAAGDREAGKTDFRSNLAVALFEAAYGSHLRMWSDETRDFWLARASAALSTPKHEVPAAPLGATKSRPACCPTCGDTSPLAECPDCGNPYPDPTPEKPADGKVQS